MSDATLSASVTALAPRGMITLKGDLEHAGFAQVVADHAAVAIPARRQILHGDGRSLAWMAPDELLLLLPHDAAPEMAAQLASALSDQHALVVEVSDARASFRISGPGAREVVAKGAPVDLSPAAFGPGEIRRTRLAQVAAAFWIGESGDIDLVCFRSVAEYVEQWLTLSAEDGTLPGYL